MPHSLHRTAHKLVLCERTRRRSTCYSQLQRLQLGAAVALPLHCQYSGCLDVAVAVSLSGVGDRCGHDNYVTGKSRRRISRIKEYMYSFVRLRQENKISTLACPRHGGDRKLPHASEPGWKINPGIIPRPSLPSPRTTPILALTRRVSERTA